MEIKIQVKDSSCEYWLKTFEAYFFMNKWPSYWQILLNTSDVTKFEKVLNSGNIYLTHPQDLIKINVTCYKQCGGNPTLFHRIKIYWKKYWEKKILTPGHAIYRDWLALMA